MNAHISARARAIHECRTVGLWGSILTNIAAIVISAILYHPTGEMWLYILLVIGISIVADRIGAEVAKIATAVWTAPVIVMGFLIIRNFLAMSFNTGGTDRVDIASVVVFLFVVSGLNAIFSYLSSRN